jgi:hypothetical protein
LPKAIDTAIRPRGNVSWIRPPLLDHSRSAALQATGPAISGKVAQNGSEVSTYSSRVNLLQPKRAGQILLRDVPFLRKAFSISQLLSEVVEALVEV